MTPAPATSPAGDPTPDADGTSPEELPTSSAVTARATSGDLVLDVEVPRPAQPPGPGVDGNPGLLQIGTDDDGAAELTVVVATDPALLVLTTPGTFAANADGTVTVRGADGTPVGGLARPTAAPAGPADGTNGPATRARLVVTGPTRVEVTVDPADAAPSDTTGVPPVLVATTLGTDALRTTSWGEREGGRSLAVDPTAWARTGGAAAQEVLWAALVAVEPEADSDTMHDQLVCHALGAPDKAAWNLEPWRPDVGLVATMAARCNPT
ncbi:DUF2599 domain-containing protein [Cellulosimicrobium terreum]|nr:DUF2599 domain-containing protein [Cellulosimicrobium terreum]